MENLKQKKKKKRGGFGGKEEKSIALVWKIILVNYYKINCVIEAWKTFQTLRNFFDFVKIWKVNLVRL